MTSSQPAPFARPAARRAIWVLAGTGFVLAFLIWVAVAPLGIGSVPLFHNRWAPLFLPVGIAGALIGMTRARVLLWIAAGSVCAVLLVVTCTPVAGPLVRGLVRRDALQPADAIVVLAGNINLKGEPGVNSQSRLLRSYKLLQQGMAGRLVLTHLPPPMPAYTPAVRRQLALIGLHPPIDDVGPVSDTHDEAVAVAALFRERGWHRVILITDATHTRRAAAVFEKAGVPVMAVPCDEPGFDAQEIRGPLARLRACRIWIKEWIGYRMYHRRGWI